MPVLIFIVSALSAICAALADRKRPRPADGRAAPPRQQVFPGLLFGLASIVGTLFSAHVADLDALVGIRDAPTIAAGLFFGPVAGIVAGTICALARAISPLLGIGAPTWMTSSFASFAAALFAAVLGHWAFGGKRPAPVPAAITAALAEILHVTIIFLLGLGDLAHTLEVVNQAIAPMSLGAAIAAAAVSLVCGSWRGWRANFFSVVSAILCLYIACFAVIWGTERRIAGRSTETAARIARDDAWSLIFEEHINFALRYAGRAVANEFGDAAPRSHEEMVRLAKLFDIDELNLVRPDGVFAGSSDADILASGGTMSDNPITRPFLSIPRYGTEFVAQSFRHGVHNTNAVCKYVGVPLPNFTDGFVQLGYSIQRLERDFLSFYGPVLSEWSIGDSGYYLVIDGDGKILLPDSVHGDACVGHALSEFGALDVASMETFTSRSTRTRLFGKSCAVHRIDVASRRVLVVVPAVDHYGPAETAAFLTSGILFAVFVIFGWALLSIVNARRKIDELRAAEDARRAEDMAMAREIQMSALPSVFPPFPREDTADLFATMEPAREVGGDFYDFYRLAPNRIAFLVADVSGKGIPAAMFMMRAKGILKSCATAEPNLGEAVTRANGMLSKDNGANMFVTCWFGVLHTEDGTVEYVNAGHNPPFVRRADGSLEPLAAISGPCLGVMDGIPYRRLQTKLGAGDSLFLYTDGVTESNNANGEMFGEDRLQAVLGALPRLPDPAPKPTDVCAAVRAALHDFVGNEPPFDDVTLFSLLYRGAPVVSERTFPAKTESMADIAGFVETMLRETNCPKNAVSDLMIAVDEIANNIVNYSGSPDLTLAFEWTRDPSAVRLVFSDSGTPYDPLSHADPDITASLDERAIGGLGILMVKNLMDDVAYEYRDGRNRLTLRKNIG